MARRRETVVPGGVAEYIASCPSGVQPRLRRLEACIREVAPEATETVSYFGIPGYLIESYDYHGMFVWFSFKAPYLRLHVRPPVFEDHRSELPGLRTTKSIVSFKADQELPEGLIKRLVIASLEAMKASIQ
jgi:uncharacterized protein YdhG (YjbR/CyaY superfamily)